MENWDKLLHEAKSKEERDLIVTNIFFEVTGIDLVEDYYTAEELVEGFMKLMSFDIGMALLIEEFEEVGIKITKEEIANLSDEKKRYLLKESKNLKEAWEIIKMLG